MKLENIDQYVSTLFLIEDLKDGARRLAKKKNMHPLQKKALLTSFYLMKEDLKNQIVTYELSRKKHSSK